jgi:hypothetical protein
MIPAHGGTPGLIVEISPLVLLVIGAVAVWWRSRDEDSEAPRTGDEPPVEEERGESQ